MVKKEEGRKKKGGGEFKHSLQGYIRCTLQCKVASHGFAYYASGPSIHYHEPQLTCFATQEHSGNCSMAGAMDRKLSHSSTTDYLERQLSRCKAHKDTLKALWRK